MYDNEKMLGLADSIKEQGVVVPILVRPIKDSKYEFEIIAGHNRVQASKHAGIDKIPCNVREMDDETATILMIDTNLQASCQVGKKLRRALQYLVLDKLFSKINSVFIFSKTNNVGDRVVRMKNISFRWFSF